jgi:hypothetical protein
MDEFGFILMSCRFSNDSGEESAYSNNKVRRLETKTD